METPRYIQTDHQSFYGDYLYEQIVPENHFLRKLNALIDWTYYTKKLTNSIKAKGCQEDQPMTPRYCSGAC